MWVKVITESRAGGWCYHVGRNDKLEIVEVIVKACDNIERSLYKAHLGWFVVLC